MSAADGQDPPHVPHWMHISSRATPAVAALTSSRNRKFGGSEVWVLGIVSSVAVVKGHLLCL